MFKSHNFVVVGIYHVVLGVSFGNVSPVQEVLCCFSVVLVGLRLCSCGWILTEQSNLEMLFLIYPGLDFSKNMALYPYDNTDRSCGNQVGLHYV